MKQIRKQEWECPIVIRPEDGGFCVYRNEGVLPYRSRPASYTWTPDPRRVLAEVERHLTDIVASDLEESRKNVGRA